MALKKGDFIEIDFTGTIKDSGEIFDTTNQDVAKKANLDIKNLKPFIFSVGHKMLPSSFDSDIEGKEVGNSYVLELKPEEAFGKREKTLIKMIPTKLFIEQKINPERGMQLSLDGQIIKILSNSGGRTLVDFNNPLAGKEITYDYTINRIIEDETEKINALQEFLFRKKFDFELKDNKIIFDVDEKSASFIMMFAQKFKEILGKEVEVKKDSQNKKENKKEDIVEDKIKK
jgi:FKBP-type peptidyl-prolyl cis-trans isomerase 2